MGKDGFHDTITADGRSGFKVEMDRYHLYVSLACPFASRAIVVRKLKGLEKVLPMTIVNPVKVTAEGWNFHGDWPDPLHGVKFLREIYELAEPAYTGRWSVPIIWDKQRRTIVNNESAEVMRFLNSEFNEFCSTDQQRQIDLYPEELRQEIDSVNDWLNPNLFLGAYAAGFATSQQQYDTAVTNLFKCLDRLEEILGERRYLCGDKLTEVDIKAFTCLIRFDPVYHTLFKCDKKRLIDYPNIWSYVREIYQLPSVRETVDLDYARLSYFASMLNLNPSGIVPIGAEIDLDEKPSRKWPDSAQN